MTTTVFYPEPNVATVAGNAYLAGGAGGSTWAGTRSQTSQDAPLFPTGAQAVFQGEDIGSINLISRSIFTVDSSVIGTDNISSATFALYSAASGDGSETVNPANGALVGATPSNTTTFSASDFSSVGTTRYCDTDVTSATFRGTGGYHSWALNATGLAAISKTGVTKLAIRASNDFSDATAPIARSYALGYYAESTGITQDPKLTAVHAAAGGAALDGNAADVVTATGALSAQIKLTGSAADVATATGSLTSNILLTGNATDIATAAGGLTAHIKLTGAAVDVVTAAGNLTAGSGLTGNATDVSTAGGALSTAIQLVGTAVSITSANGSLSAQIKLSGTALAQALATAGLTTGINLNGSAQDITTAAGTLLTAIKLTGDAQNIVLATATITTQIKLTGNASDVATATASFDPVAAQLEGNAQDASTAVGTLTTQVKLTAAAIVEALVTGSLSANIFLAGNALNVVTSTGILNGSETLLVVRPYIVYVPKINFTSVYVPKNFKVNV